MDVPLAAWRTIVDEAQYVTVWTRGERRLVEAPFAPYAYTRQPIEEGPAASEPVEVRPLSTLEPATYHRHRFRNVRDVVAHVHPLDTGGGTPGPTADDHVPYIHRVMLDEPDWFRSFPNGRPPRLLTFDVEQLTDGTRFPTRDDPLISIAWSIDDGEPECVVGDGRSDADIVEAFVAAVAATDPDLISGYNVAGYDLPLLVHRCEANRVDAGRLARTGRVTVDDGRRRGRGGSVRLDGRLVYDVYDRVRQDQTMYGIKDRKLKTVARWRGIDAIEEDTSNTAALVGTERLREYNVSDVHACREIGRPYLRALIELAEFYGAPLNVVMDATANFHCTMLQGRVFAKRGIVSDGTNGQRHPEFYGGAAGDGYVGGIVEIYQRGRFEPLSKVDFSSMYPSVLVALGLGADNTRLVGREALGPYRATRDGDRLTISAPDAPRGVNHVVEVRGRSELAEELGRLLERRLELKRQAGATDDDAERERLDAQQAMVKVILNSVYGVMASKHARYGAMPVAVAIVGTARRLIRIVEEGLGEAKIETDTDGVYAEGTPAVDGLERAVNDFMEGMGGRPTMRLSLDTYAAGWFHEKKSYVLLHHDGRLEKHGVAFKGSSRCTMFDAALDGIARALLEGRDDVDVLAHECLQLDRYEPDDFVMRVRMGKKLADYESPNHVAAQVARAHKRRGLSYGAGQQLSYVKVRGGYDAAVGDAFERLDEEYYTSMLERLMGKLGVVARDPGQTRLGRWV